MTDAPIETDPLANATSEAQAALTPETFDVASWLGGTSYPTGTIEIYRGGEAIAQLAELTEFLDAKVEEKETRVRQTLRPNQAKSITDAVDDETEGAVADALLAVAQLRDQLKGTGATFHLKGIAPGVRKVMREKIARELKPRKAIPATDTEPETPAVPGGENHPEFDKRFEREVIRKTIQKVVFPNGAEDTHSFTADEIANLETTLPGQEYQRLANEVFKANFISYEIDQLVNVDFSSRL